MRREIPTVLSTINQNLRKEPEGRFLESYLACRGMFKRETKNWKGLYDECTKTFNEVYEEASAIIRVFLLHYRFLCLRQATKEKEAIGELFGLRENAMNAIDQLTEGKALAQAMFHFATLRWFKRIKQIEQSLIAFDISANASKQWYHEVKGWDDEPVIVFEAAKEIRELPTFYRQTFGILTTTPFFIEDELMHQVEATIKRYQPYQPQET